MFHGLLAYRKEYGIGTLLKRADTALSGVTLSTSNRPIGKIGLFFDGKIHRMFGRDCWSKVVDGKRVIDDDVYNPDGFYWRHDGLTSKEWECESVEEALEIHKAYGTRYAEFFESFSETGKLRFVWVKYDAPEWYKKASRVLARRLKTELIELSDKVDLSDAYEFDRSYAYVRNSWWEYEYVNKAEQPVTYLEILEEKLCGY